MEEGCQEEDGEFSETRLVFFGGAAFELTSFPFLVAVVDDLLWAHAVFSNQWDGELFVFSSFRARGIVVDLPSFSFRSISSLRLDPMIFESPASSPSVLLILTFVFPSRLVASLPFCTSR